MCGRFRWRVMGAQQHPPARATATICPSLRGPAWPSLVTGRLGGGSVDCWICGGKTPDRAIPLAYSVDVGSTAGMWSPVDESNARPTPYKGVALPHELTGRIWLRERDLNRRHPGYEPGALPLSYPAIWVRGESKRPQTTANCTNPQALGGASPSMAENVAGYQKGVEWRLFAT